MPLKNHRVTKQSTKRGDTIIEAMFAFAVFSLVAIITVSMMNLGVAASERSLELTTVRNELNAQADALRFIHSSYIAQQNLPPASDCSGSNSNCQHYTDLWEAIVGRTLPSNTDRKLDYPLASCKEVYEEKNEKLRNSGAFIINTRRLSSYSGAIDVNSTLIDAGRQTSGMNPDYLFTEPTLSARIIYGNSSGNSSDQLSHITKLSDYTEVKKVEGIWIIGVKGQATGGSAPQYYDFYIETCWYGSNNSTPTSLDTVVRLYNPGGV